MKIPFEPTLFGTVPNIHLILEYAAFFVAFRYYLYLRKNEGDSISSANRLSIIIGAVFGALIVSRVMAFLENPPLHYEQGWLAIVNNKTIMGGLFGGLLGVELMKKFIGEQHSSGDLFTLPILLGIIIGRVGCLLAGINEFTYGKATTLFLGMDLGDGLLRHPIALYEILYLILLFTLIKITKKKNGVLGSGYYFKLFMVAYFGFRFCVEFLKPNSFFILGISSIQLLCLICWAYYYRFIHQLVLNVRK